MVNYIMLIIIKHRDYHTANYRKWGKICWAKLVGILPPNEVFYGKNFAVAYIENT